MCCWLIADQIARSKLLLFNESWFSSCKFFQFFFWETFIYTGPRFRVEFTIKVQICGSADRGSKFSAVPIRGSQQFGCTKISPEELRSSDRRSKCDRDQRNQRPDWLASTLSFGVDVSIFISGPNISFKSPGTPRPLVHSRFTRGAKGAEPSAARQKPRPLLIFQHFEANFGRWRSQNLDVMLTYKQWFFCCFRYLLGSVLRYGML